VIRNVRYEFLVATNYFNQIQFLEFTGENLDIDSLDIDNTISLNGTMKLKIHPNSDNENDSNYYNKVYEMKGMLYKDKFEFLPSIG